jgi:DNA primase
MSKLAQSTSKYTIYAEFDADGTVEKPDVIGAVFGQTEGLMGPDMELRELQKTGRIGRIDVELRNNDGKTSGVIIIPSSLDRSETAMIAASIETIERVGPCSAKIIIQRIEDVRTSKRMYVVERAKEILEGKFGEGYIETDKISEEIKEAVRGGEITDYRGLPAGPDIEDSDSIIVVEGRADVLKLLKNGIRNAIAIEGTSVPETIVELSKEKMTTTFLDGDRGGDLILKELLNVCDIDFIARATEGKEVEDLTKKEIFKQLRDKSPTLQRKKEFSDKKPKPQYEKEEKYEKHHRPTVDGNKLEKFKGVLNDLIGTRAACFLNEEMNILGKVPVKEMFGAMRELKNANTLVFDGDIDQKLINQCSMNNIKYIIGMKSARIRTQEGMVVLTLQNLK